MGWLQTPVAQECQETAPEVNLEACARRIAKECGGMECSPLDEKAGKAAAILVIAAAATLPPLVSHHVTLII